MITSKRHPFKFYFPLLFGSFFFLALGVVMLHLFFDQRDEGNTGLKTLLMPLFCVILFFLCFYTLRQYFKNTPKIRVDRKQIFFGTDMYQLSDISKIKFNGKFPFKYLISFPMEGASIKFKNGNEKLIFNDMYSNTWEIKLFLDSVISNKQFQNKLDDKISSEIIRFESFEFFKGLQITSFRGIMLWGFIGAILIPFFINSKTPPIGFFIFTVTFGAFWIALNSWLMHFFGVSDKYLIVKNHNFFWRLKIYRLSNIKEVVYESQGKQPNCLRIITNNYRNKLYPACTLRDKTWLELKKILEKKGVKVRNECIF
ncbi:hypothetical protein [Hanstruepera marina]|uniref:hypothetical protein n=1 Tax=Hanstruepera marina TaxID=2873265 RepID=UPI001CA73171|nr:hypothetical protein [Hanstruepera marina]